MSRAACFECSAVAGKCPIMSFAHPSLAALSVPGICEGAARAQGLGLASRGCEGVEDEEAAWKIHHFHVGRVSRRFVSGVNLPCFDAKVAGSGTSIDGGTRGRARSCVLRRRWLSRRAGCEVECRTGGVNLRVQVPWAVIGCMPKPRNYANAGLFPERPSSVKTCRQVPPSRHARTTASTSRGRGVLDSCSRCRSTASSILMPPVLVVGCLAGAAAA